MTESPAPVIACSMGSPAPSTNADAIIMAMAIIHWDSDLTMNLLPTTPSTTDACFSTPGILA